jgi:inorganic pyrophosphatase
MSFKKLKAGSNVPEDVHVVIEIPTQSHPIKYEVDKETGIPFVDRFMSTAMHYPCNYGYIPQTLSEDGDPTDVLVISPFPLMMGSVIRSRPVGMLQMEDESGIDAKILAVPIAKLSPAYQNVNDIGDVCQQLLKTISHFFEHYKDLETGKWVKVKGWLGAEAAKAEIMESIQRYHANQEK